MRTCPWTVFTVLIYRYLSGNGKKWISYTTFTSGCRKEEVQSWVKLNIYLFKLCGLNSLYIYRYIDNVMYILDERVEDWLLMKTPVPISIIFVLYVLLVFLGPRFMRNREPLQLKTFIVPYNFILILLSIYMFYEVGKHIVFWFKIYQLFLIKCWPLH